MPCAAEPCRPPLHATPPRVYHPTPMTRPRSRRDAAPASVAVEDYLKAILGVAAATGDEEVPIGRIAEAVGVTPGTVTSMVKRLRDEGLVRYQRFGGVALTVKGAKLATDVLRRHRLVESFLTRTLGLDWSIVHEEAERLEHAVSPVVLEALDRHLGFPELDPHGDPIPGPDGAIRRPTPAVRALASCPAGSAWILVRTLDQRGETLRYLHRSGLTIGASVAVLARDAVGGTIRVRPDRKPAVTLGLAAAEALVVEPEGRPPAAPRRPRSGVAAREHRP
jgi:DtxR family transcriptional regulator, Mn-dependent transcriptional regulator